MQDFKETIQWRIEERRTKDYFESIGYKLFQVYAENGELLLETHVDTIHNALWLLCSNAEYQDSSFTAYFENITVVSFGAKKHTTRYKEVWMCVDDCALHINGKHVVCSYEREELKDREDTRLQEEQPLEEQPTEELPVEEQPTQACARTLEVEQRNHFNLRYRLTGLDLDCVWKQFGLASTIEEASKMYYTSFKRGILLKIQDMLNSSIVSPLPLEEQPTEEQPTEEQPTEEQPTEEQPTEEQPTEEQPTEELLTEEQPTNFIEDIQSYGFSLEEIACIYGVSLSSVRKWKKGAKPRLQAILKFQSTKLLNRYTYDPTTNRMTENAVQKYTYTYSLKGKEHFSNIWV